ncbi:MAG: hypothetical protein R8M11_08255, partial [Gallionella sp.]
LYSALLFLFWLREDIGLKSFFGSGVTGSSKIFGEITLFGALGFVYCYVASTPILVMHCCRYNRSGLTNIFGSLGIGIVVLLALLVVGFFAYLAGCVGWSKTASQFVVVVPIAMGFALILLQYRLLHDLCANYQHLGNFYCKLDKKRKYLSVELKDSYKHLREHGNASLIVVLEVVLAAFIYALVAIAKELGVSESEVHWMLLIAFALWVSPAAFVWYVGGVILESELTTKYFDKIN